MLTLKDVRENRGFTQVQIATRMGVNQRTVRRWEQGDTEIPSGRLIPLSRFLKISVRQLLELWAEMAFIDAELLSRKN